MIVKGEGAVEGRDRTQRRTLRTRRRLLEAALVLFGEKGVDAITIEAITERADVGKGTFYRHFSSKNEVVAALVTQAAERLAGRVAAPEGRPESLEGALAHLLNVHSKFLIENCDEFVLLFQGRVLLSFQRGAGTETEQPYARYLEALGEQVAPFLRQPPGTVRVRQLACALAEYAFGARSLAVVGLGAQQAEASLAPLRRAFVAASAAFLAREESAPQTSEAAV
jgi:AcrR family transcriptional regulator